MDTLIQFAYVVSAALFIFGRSRLTTAKIEAARAAGAGGDG